MRTGEADILFVPGRGETGADHWLSRWQSRLKTARRLDDLDRTNPNRDAWAAQIQQAVAQAQRPVILVAHSLGAAAVAHAATGFPPDAVRGGFLVSAPSEQALRSMDIDPAFAPPPRAPLPFPSLLIASQDDPFSTFADMESMALDWGAQIIDAGPAGHIDESSGHGPWPEGLMRFGAFLARL